MMVRRRRRARYVGICAPGLTQPLSEPKGRMPASDPGGRGRRDSHWRRGAGRLLWAYMEGFARTLEPEGIQYAIRFLREVCLDSAKFDLVDRHNPDL